MQKSNKLNSKPMIGVLEDKLRRMLRLRNVTISSDVIEHFERGNYCHFYLGSNPDNESKRYVYFIEENYWVEEGECDFLKGDTNVSLADMRVIRSHFTDITLSLVQGVTKHQVPGGRERISFRYKGTPMSCPNIYKDRALDALCE